MTRERFLAGLAANLLRVLFMTVRLRLDDRSGLLAGHVAGPVLVAFWHNRILGITLAFQRVYPFASRGGVTVLTSPSRDGEILSAVVAAFGMGSVRGSSSRRGSQALRELVRLVEAGRDIAITPDGPRGPRYTLGPGLISLAQMTGAPILPMHASFSRCVRMKTWDGFIIPLPFSTISVTLDSLIKIPAKPDDFEAARLTVEDCLKNAAD